MISVSLERGLSNLWAENPLMKQPHESVLQSIRIEKEWKRLILVDFCGYFFLNDVVWNQNKTRQSGSNPDRRDGKSTDNFLNIRKHECDHHRYRYKLYAKSETKSLR